MLARVLSAAIYGIEAYLVEVEVDLAMGLPVYATVGRPDAAVRESKDRVKSAIKNSGYEFPARRITVNLAPAHIRKDGAAFDLPIAVGLMAAAGTVSPELLPHYLILGELSLDGRVKPVRGVLPMAAAARQAGLKGVLLAERNAPEAAVVVGLEVLPVGHFSQLVGFLNGSLSLTPYSDAPLRRPAPASVRVDFSEIRGQEHAKRALEVAAAGAHNLLMVGPPGAGKTMLARRLPTILPELTFEEALETTRIYSVLGLLSAGAGLISTRPFRGPHHTISDVGLIGGGSVPRPGEVSLAHNGVLFLDELPEFGRHVLEALRQPLEDGQVTVVRAAQACTFPARVMLVATTNPCPCGYAGDAVRPCCCSAAQLHRYRGRLSGPLLDRLDLHLEVPAVPSRELLAPGAGEPSAQIRARVEAARSRQRARFCAEGIHANAQMLARHLTRYCPLARESEQLLQQAMDRLRLSARALSRILKVARTIADLEGAERLELVHVAEAVQYRSLDRPLPG